MIAVDTSALLWAVKGTLGAKLTHTAQMQAIQEMGGPLWLPAPALAEYMVKIPKDLRQ